MFRRAAPALGVLRFVVAASLHAQIQMPGMDFAPPAATLIATELAHTSSGTSLQPASTPMPMLMRRSGDWTLMLHGEGFLSEIQQHAANSRGGDKLFSTNWVMPMAQRRLGARGQLTVRAMISLEPATISNRSYPELFQQGETAYGRPIVDGQHPHDFIMELGALYDLRIGEHSLLSLYAAPIGDPAIGPTAYPHRQSASEDPLATLGHHQQDSTHIAFNVLTAGYTWRTLRVEASGFHGGEPGESRWSAEPSPNGHAIDSASARVTWSPTQNLTAQYSAAQIAQPEAVAPGQNQRRYTASLMLNRSIGVHHDTTAMPGMDMASSASGNWATSLIWGRTRNQSTGLVEQSYLVESLLTQHANSVWLRAELAARTTELLPDAPPVEASAGHVQAYTLGYDRNVTIGSLQLAPGVQFALDHSSAVLAPVYGKVPFSAVAFVRVRVGH